MKAGLRLYIADAGRFTQREYFSYRSIRMCFQEYMKSKIGVLKVTANEEGITGVCCAEGEEIPRDARGNALTAEGVKQLTEYFAGRRRSFSLPLCLEGTPFQREVWEVLRSVEFGKTLTYSEVAAKAGKPQACRAAGTAIGAQSALILVPCHRILGKNGALTGFSAGLWRKKELLVHEGIEWK